MLGSSINPCLSGYTFVLVSDGKGFGVGWIHQITKFRTITTSTPFKSELNLPPNYVFKNFISLCESEFANRNLPFGGYFTMKGGMFFRVLRVLVSDGRKFLINGVLSMTT